MEINSGSIQFYSQINGLVNIYQEENKKEKLDHIYHLIKEHF
jgi:hypothetical protein